MPPVQFPAGSTVPTSPKSEFLASDNALPGLPHQEQGQNAGDFPAKVPVPGNPRAETGSPQTHPTAIVTYENGPWKGAVLTLGPTKAQVLPFA